MKKKMVSVLLTASMLAGMTMFAVPVMAEDAAPENEVTGDASADDSFVVWGWNDDIKKILDGPFKEAYPDDYERIVFVKLSYSSNVTYLPSATSKQFISAASSYSFAETTIYTSYPNLCESYKIRSNNSFNSITLSIE